MEIMIIGFRGLRILNIDKSNGKRQDEMETAPRAVPARSGAVVFTCMRSIFNKVSQSRISGLGVRV